MGSGTETLYNVIQGSLADPDLSMSVGPPLPERQWWAAMVTVASPTVQEPKAMGRDPS